MEKYYSIRDKGTSGATRTVASGGGTDFDGTTMPAGVGGDVVAVPTAIVLESDASLMFNLWVTLSNTQAPLAYPAVSNNWCTLAISVYDGTTTKTLTTFQTIYVGEDTSINIMFTTSLTAGAWTVSLEYVASDLNVSASESTLTWMICEYNEDVEDLTVS